MQGDLMRAIAVLRPGVDCADTNGTLAGVRWDTPCEPPTQAEVDTELARLATPPIETSKLRFALELKARGMWPAVKAAIEANEDASMYWDFTDIVRSDNQMLVALAGQMGVSAAQVREIVAAAIARQV